MDAKEWLNTQETKKRIVQITYRAHSEPRKKEWRFGNGTVYVVDEAHRIGILLTDFGDVDETNLRAGDVVRFKSAHPEVNEILIDSSATIRPDSEPKIPFAGDRQTRN